MDQNTFTVTGVVTGSAFDASAVGDWGILRTSSGSGKNKVVLDEGPYHFPFEMTVTCLKPCPTP